MIKQKEKKRTFLQRFLTDPLTVGSILCLWFFLKKMPLDTASAFGAGLGTAVSVVMKKKNKTALHNLKKCFPEKTEKEHRAILRAMWRHFGRMMGELPHMQRIYERIQIVGAEYIQEAKKDGKGGFFCSAHLGNWELCGLVMHKAGVPLHLVYRKANNPWAEKFLYQKRQLPGAQLIPKGTRGAKKIIELILQGEHIGVLCDQKLKEGIEVPFFGYLVKTAPAVATVALKMNVPIFPARVIRLKGAHYKLEVLPKMLFPNSPNQKENVYEIMKSINELLEKWIREHPEQWLWIHHRWPKEEYND